MVRIGTEIYVYNFTIPALTQNTIYGGTWSKFSGLMARQTVHYEKLNGDLICAGSDGRVFDFDNGVYSDAGSSIPTKYKTSWLSLEKSRSVRIKEGKYLKPLVESGAGKTFTITAEGSFQSEGDGDITLSTSGVTRAIGQFTIGSDEIGGSKTANIKVPLRWRGEVVRLTFETDDTTGPDTIGRFSVYHNVRGRR